jgi:hypothetical protein
MAVCHEPTPLYADWDPTIKAVILTGAFGKLPWKSRHILIQNEERYRALANASRGGVEGRDTRRNPADQDALPAYPPGPSLPQPSYTPQAARSGGNIARQLNQRELNYLQAAPVNPPLPPYLIFPQRSGRG